MEFIYNIAEYIATYLDMAFAILFITYTLGKNIRITNNRTFVFITIASIAILGYLQDHTTDSVVQDISIFTICFLFSLSLLDKSVGQKIIVTIVYLILLSFSNMFVTYTIVSFTQISIEQLCSPGILRLFLLLFHKIVFFILLFVASTLLRKQTITYQFCLIATLLFTGILFSCSILINITKAGNLTLSQETQLLIVTIGLCAISVAVTICVYQMNQQHQKEIENTKLLSRLQDEEVMLNRITELYDNNRILQHDLTRHFSIIQGFLEQNLFTEAKSYIMEVTQQQLSHATYVYTNSNILNHVLNEKAEQCKKSNIIYQITISGTIDKSLEMNLGIILSNLLDNAIEAECRQNTNNRKILLHLQQDKGMYYITIKNYIDASVLSTNPSLFTNKADKKHHGWGVRSVRKIVQSLDGIYQQYEQDSYFITTIILPDSTKCA